MNSSRVSQVNLRCPDQKLIQKAADIIAENGAVVAPTETCYGLLVRADRNQNLERIYQMKKRAGSLPTAVFLRNIDDLSAHAEVNPTVQELADHFLPGPLTLVLKARTDRPSPAAINGKLGIRISSSPVVAAILGLLDMPLTATSANISGQPDPVVIEDAVTAFGDEVRLYLDAGRLNDQPSTVVDCTGGAPEVLREGAIKLGQLEQFWRSQT